MPTASSNDTSPSISVGEAKPQNLVLSGGLFFVNKKFGGEVVYNNEF